MGLDLGTISASVGLNTGPLAAGAVKAKAMFSGLDKSMSGGLKGSEKGLAGLGNSLKNLAGFGGTATNSLGALGSQLGALGAIGLVAGAVIGLGAAFYSCAKAAEEEQRVNAQTKAVIASTGGVANVTAGHVDELGNSLAQLSGVSHDTIKSAENIMLTFRGVANVGKDKIFDESIKSTLDMSIALGKDLSDSAIKVGKALQDPVKGLTALRRYGVMFTDEQVTMAKQMVATGHTMDAQKMILEELKTEFGGSAEAFGSTLAGNIGKLKDSWDKFKESIGNTSLPTLTGFLKVLNDISKVKFPDKFAPKIEITTDAGKAAKEAAKALAAFDKGMAKGGIISVLAKVDRTELINAKQEIDNLGKDVPEIVLRFRDVGLAGTTQKEVQGMIKMMADYEPTMRESGIKLFKGIMDAEAYSHPQIKAGMDQITTDMTDKVMGMKTGEFTQAKMNEIVQAEIAAHPECASEMNLIMATLNQILAGPVTPPNIPVPTVTDPIPTAQGVTTSLNNWFGGNPAHPIIGGVFDRSNYASIAAGVTAALQSAFNSNPAHPVISKVAVQLSPVRIFSSAAAAGAYIASRISGGISAGMSKNPASITLSGGASGGSIFTDLAAATDLVRASFGNFLADMTAAPLNEVNDAIMRLTANNYSSLGDWWKLRGAYDAGTAALAKYTKQITAGEKAITTLEGAIEKDNAAIEKTNAAIEKTNAVIEKTNAARDAAHDRPSLLMDKQSNQLQLQLMKVEDAAAKSLANYTKQIEAGGKAITTLEGAIEKANAARERPSLTMGKQQSELQLKIMKAEDAHNYALAAKLTLQKDTLDRKKEELDLTTQIADEAKGLKDTSAFSGKTTAQIDAQIAKYAGQLAAKEKEVAATQVKLDRVQASVDKSKIPLDALDRKKEELSLATAIADQAKEIADNPLMKSAAGKVLTVAQIDALLVGYAGQVSAKEKSVSALEIQIKSLEGRITAKEKSVAALKITYDKVQASVDTFKKIIDDLAAYFTSKSPAPSGAGYASGSTYVPRTGMALVHQGEQIIPANLNPLVLGRGGDTLITVPLYLDGKLIAKSVSRYQGGQANNRAMSGGRY